MSSINDALRRSSRARDDFGRFPQILSGGPQEAPRRAGGFWLILSLAALAGAVLLWFLLPPDPKIQTPASRPAETAANIPAPLRPRPEAETRPAPPEEVRPAPSEAETRPAPPEEVRPAPSDQARASDEDLSAPRPAPEADKPAGDGSDLTALEHFETGRLAQEASEFKIALRHYRLAVELDPNLIQAWVNLGNIHLEQGRDLDRAGRMYEKALNLDPTHKLAHNNLAVVQMRQGRLEQARKHLAAAVGIDPEFTDAVYNLACLYARMGRKDLAMQQLLQAVRLDPMAAEWAAEDQDLLALRGIPEYNSLIRQENDN